MPADVESPTGAQRGPAPALARATAAVSAIRERNLHRIGHWVPFTRIGASAWPPPGRPLSKQRLTASWNYWWQAHLLDLLVDAALLGDERAAGEANALVRGIKIRNTGRWTNAYYDDMAWLALAVERCDRHLNGPGHARGQRILTDVLYAAWAPDHGGGIPWRTTDHFFNVPANGPAGIFLARRGRVERAVATADWINETMLLPSGLIADGFWVESDGSRRYINAMYTYCQGVALGLYLECFGLTREPRHLERLEALLGVVEQRCTTNGVVIGAGGGDGGLFAGILVRNLALIVTDLPTPHTVAERRHFRALSARARAIVLASAESAWAHRAEYNGLPVFGADWSSPAAVPTTDGEASAFIGGAVRSSSSPERDLSVQISGAMAMTAAALITLRSPEDTGTVTPG
ncbi:MAG: glycoside hydrolase family 76 protein [Gordonia sp. (in: high G+C Gram-positive bacteria)]|uniref:glycoside hydrolase family 76 protein n=1 Tax=Gordonia sp. (in: high G+C Gram-positive bacteria) TaxID=84139 RepID=UPI003BB72DDD